MAGIEEIELALVKPWGVGHRQTPQHRFTGGHMNQAAAAGLVLAPAVFRIGFAQGGHIGRCAAGFVDGQPVEVAAIPQLPAADEGRLPLRRRKLQLPSIVTSPLKRVFTSQWRCRTRPGHGPSAGRCGDRSGQGKRCRARPRA